MKKIAGVIVMVCSVLFLKHYSDAQKACAKNPPEYNSDHYFDCREFEDSSGALAGISGLILGGMLFFSRKDKEEE